MVSDTSSTGPNDGAEAIRKAATPERPKRFYKEALCVPTACGFALQLDSRAARTPARNPLEVPFEAVTEAMAAEWAAQDSHIFPETMPVTRLANSIIDGVLDRKTEVADVIAEFAGTDLLCYRADTPEGLVQKQNTAWNPVLDWVADTFGARPVLIEGIMHQSQPPQMLAAIRQHLVSLDGYTVGALHVVTTLTGSVFLAMSLHARVLTADQVWDAAHVDEDWQFQAWGSDAEAMERRAKRRQDFDAASLFIDVAGA
ncbi:MAG: ATP12 family protein [Pseudomonadota bacterium]